VFFGYRAMGVVAESRSADIAEGTRLFGNWRHTESVVMPAAQAVTQRLPDELTDDDGVDVAQMGPICVNAVAFGAGEQVSHPTVVFGAGPVGLITAQIVRASGAGEVLVVDRIASRLAIAESLGLRPIDASAVEDVAAELKREFGSEGIPVAFECTGSTAALHEAIRVVRRRGLVVAVGFYQGEASQLWLGDEFHHNGIRVVCGQIGNVHPTLDWPSLRERVIDLVRSGQLRLGELPRLELPVEQAADAFAALKRPAEVLQVVLSY
jgi:threonine dehydrogenase-like Zn-dependent dehydrogenase